MIKKIMFHKTYITVMMIVVLGLVGSAYVGYNKMHGKITHVYLTEEINMKTVMPAITALNEAKTGDTIVLHIESPGGSVMAGDVLIDAMQGTKGKTVTVVKMYAASMAALITLYGQEKDINPNALFIFHEYQLMGMPLGPNQTSPDLKLIRAQFEAQFNEVVAPVLTQVQEAAVNEGLDVVVSGEQINEALKKGGI